MTGLFKKVKRLPQKMWRKLKNKFKMGAKLLNE
jgi:hypothetical protein